MTYRPPILPTPVQESGLFARLSGAAARSAAIARAKNALILSSFQDFDAIRLSAGDGFLEDTGQEFTSLLEEVVFHIAKDGRFDADEREYVLRFIKATSLPKSSFESAYRAGVRRAMGMLIDQAVQSGTVDIAARTRLADVARRFEVPSSEFQASLSTAISVALGARLTNALEDGLLSDDEWRSLEVLASGFGVEFTIGNNSAKDVEFARDRWRAMSGTLNPVSAEGMSLKQGERVFFDGDAEWFELKTVSRTVSYGGLTGSVRIAKGLRFRYGSLSVSAPPVESVQLIDQGRLVLSDDRLVFLGNRANKSIQWKSVLAVNVQGANLFEIEKATGKSPILRATSDRHGRLLLASSIAAGIVNART